MGPEFGSSKKAVSWCIEGTGFNSDNSSASLSWLHALRDQLRHKSVEERTVSTCTLNESMHEVRTDMRTRVLTEALRSECAHHECLQFRTDKRSGVLPEQALSNRISEG